MRLPHLVAQHNVREGFAVWQPPLTHCRAAPSRAVALLAVQVVVIQVGQLLQLRTGMGR